MSVVRGVTILGSTGSIGVSTLDVISLHPERFRVIALSANTQVDKLFAQCQQVKPRYAVMQSKEHAEALHKKISDANLAIEVLGGDEALEQISALPEVHYVMAAIVGGAGLRPTMAAVCAGKTVLLANKESLVMSGDLFVKAVRDHGATLLPIDSEHNAIFQALPRNAQGTLEYLGVNRILLTASGGPFREKAIDTLHSVTPDEACAHPNWSMGRKISVDSATMMNKGLEVIEAGWLFGASPDVIEIVIHPQSVIHSMVSYNDGSVIAQMGNPDMRTPIAYGLGFPERIQAGVLPLDLTKIGRLDFEPLDIKRFPCVEIAYQAMRTGGTAPAIMNAANEIAVAAFLSERISFTSIPSVIQDTLERLKSNAVSDLEDVFEADVRARAIAEDIVEKQNP